MVESLSYSSYLALLYCYLGGQGQKAARGNGNTFDLAI
jgi:hypothetical protein